MIRVPKGYVRRVCMANEKDEPIADVTLRTRVDTLETLPVDIPYVVLDDVWVAQGYRGRGLSTIVLKAAQDVAKSEGWAIACRPQSHDNGPSQAQLVKLYRRLGWTQKVRSYPLWLLWRPSLDS